MAITWTPTKPTPNPDYTSANKRVRVRDFGPVTNVTYTAGGDSITPAMFGLKVLHTVEPQGLLTNGTLAFQCSYDYTNQKLKVFGTNAVPGAAVGDPELTAATSLSGYSVRLRAVGY